MSSSFVTIFLLGLGASALAYNQTKPTMIESKLDGKVLTVTNDIVPPSGPYQRNGVAALAKNSTISQHWIFETYDDPMAGTLYAVNATYSNSITTGLGCDDCFSYTYYYDLSNVTADGSRLLKRIDLFSDEKNRCVKNLGGDAFITDDVCDEKDPSQLWIVHHLTQ